MADAVIFGAGGLGRMVRDILRQGGAHRPVAFLDSAPRLWGATVDGLPVRGDIGIFETLQAEGVNCVVVAIGASAARIAVAERLERLGARLISAIHPLAICSPTARLGRHVIAGARAIVGVHAVVRDHVVLSPGCIVEHDNELQDGAFLEPAVRLAGGVTVGRCARVGIGACVIPGRTIGADSRVEPGGVVISDVPPGCVVGGAPATARQSDEQAISEKIVASA
jgi:acetyltransferase EpsM